MTEGGALLTSAEAVGLGGAQRAVHQRGGPALSALLPGAPQLLAGRRSEGLLALVVWVFLWWTATLHPARLVAAPAGSLDDWVAILTLVGGLLGVWGWSMRDVLFGAGGPAAQTQWSLALRTFKRNRTAVAGLIAMVVLYLTALLTPLLAPMDPIVQGDLVTLRYAPPSPDHLLGTDRFARDVLSRMLYGARISLSIGFVAVGISVTIGTVVGSVAGFLGGWVDTVIMRVVDVVISIPRIVLLIAIIAALQEPASIFLIIAVLGFTQWPYTSRIVRSEVLSLREREYVQAAKALGYTRWRIIRRHLIPNALAPVIVAATLGIGNTIVIESGLSFLCLGIQPPTPSWGSMAADGRNVLLTAWWLSTFPGFAIVLVVLSFNLVGDGLRDALDPRLRK